MVREQLATRSAAGGRVLRAGSTIKRRAILDAARALFLADGYDRTSVDAVASHAEVSKRTVYDYFGDKRRLLLAVVEDLGEEVMASVRSTIDETLTDLSDLSEALFQFAHSIADSALGSDEYHALLRLASLEERNLPELRGSHWLNYAPEELLAERFAILAEQGLIDSADPALAVDHLVALTLGAPRAYSFTTRPEDKTPDARRKRIAAGVAVFLAAYGTERC